jgi:hypothetical protein
MSNPKQISKMKKLLLFIFALAIGVTAMGQKKVTTPVKPCLMPNKVVERTIDNSVNTAPPATNVVALPSSNTDAISNVLIGGSRNAFTLLTEEQTCLWYNKDLNTLMATYRGNNYGTFWLFGTGDDVITHYSTDNGDTWDNHYGVSFTGVRHRYPSGVIYNPAGNTTIDNAYSVVAGPRTDGSAWIANYFASVKYDGSDSNAQYLPTVNSELIRGGMNACDDASFHISGMAYSTSYLSATSYIRNGLWNTGSNTVDWSTVEIDESNDVFANPTDGTLTMYFGWTNGAWSQDGSVGYFVIRGSDNRPSLHPSYSPIIYKSTDHGATWNLLDYFDFGTLPEIQNWILPINTDPNTYLPYFDNIDITVDGMGLPHIFALVRGCYSSNPDSLNYVYVAASDGHCIDNNVFELYLDEANNWHAVWIDSIVTDDVPDASSPYYSSSGNVGWGHRLQASRTTDGSVVFATWTESDYQTWATERIDLNPDLKIWGRNVYSYLNTPVVNVTALTADWGLVFFHFTSPITPDEGGVYSVPVEFSDINAEGLNADNPTYHYYMKGVTLQDPDFTLGGTQPVANTASVNVTGCYPNPVSGTTKVDVTVPQASNVSLIVTSVTGQTVINTNYGTFSAGTHTLAIDCSRLTSGVYFYTLTVGQKQYTDKIIVK